MQEIVSGIIVFALLCLGVIMLAKLVAAAVTSLTDVLPALILLWFLIMVLQGMVKTLLR